jgi:6-methylsalicylate decarboxylase
LRVSLCCVAHAEQKEWSEEDHLTWMASANISKSILSITSPGTHLVPGNDTLAKSLTRECNEFAADLKSRHPDKFGFFASLPLPDIEASLEEIKYAFDELDADGVTVLTNAHGLYLGDDELQPVFDALEERGATVFVHPAAPCIGDGQSVSSSAEPLGTYPSPMFEYFFDTARAVMNLFLRGVVDRCPSVTFIISHAGGALPPLVDRFTNFASSLPDADVPGDASPNAVKDGLMRQFYFDLAGFPFPDQIHGLLRYVDESRLMYGSDMPYTPPPVAVQLGKLLTAGLHGLWPAAEDRAAILRDNAEALFG